MCARPKWNWGTMLWSINAQFHKITIGNATRAKCMGYDSKIIVC